MFLSHHVASHRNSLTHWEWSRQMRAVSKSIGGNDSEFLKTVTNEALRSEVLDVTEKPSPLTSLKWRWRLALLRVRMFFTEWIQFAYFRWYLGGKITNDFDMKKLMSDIVEVSAQPEVSAQA